MIIQKNIYANYIEKSNLRFKKIERSLRNEKILRFISEVIVSDIPLKQIADKIVKILGNHLKINRCILYDYSKGKISFLSEYCDKVTKSITRNKENLNDIARYINLHNSLFKKINQSNSKNTIFINNNIFEDGRLIEINDIFKKYQINSQLSIVITFNGKINGGLILNQNNKYNWSVLESKFLEIVAEQFSIAIDRSHSLDKVMEVNKQLLDKTIKLRKTLKEEKKLRMMQSEFVAMVSHEFKTPLQIIDSTREVIARKFKSLSSDDAFITKFLDKIKHSISRLNDLIEGNLNLAKIETSKNSIKVNKEIFSLKELILTIIDRNSNLAAKKNIAIKFNLNHNNSYYNLNADKKLLDHCFTNIIANAIKYSPDNSEVAINYLIDGNDIIIKVQDQGIGISQDDLANIEINFLELQMLL